MRSRRKRQYETSLVAQYYGAMFVSGFGFAASYYGLPDIDDGYVDPEVACHVVERLGASGVILEDQQRPRRCWHADGKQILLLQDYLEKLNLVLQTRDELLVVARTDATEESEILRRAEALAATDADMLLVDGLRSVDWIRRVRAVIGDKPLLFNQIAGGKSPRLSLTELEDLGVNAVIYSTPCLFAVQTAIDNALLELRANDGRLPEVTEGAVDVAASVALLERNISRNHKIQETVEA